VLVAVRHRNELFSNVNETKDAFENESAIRKSAMARRYRQHAGRVRYPDHAFALPASPAAELNSLREAFTRRLRKSGFVD
jgi:hypothetical protein